MLMIQNHPTRTCSASPKNIPLSPNNGGVGRKEKPRIFAYLIPPLLGARGLLLLTAALLVGCGHPAQETAAHKIADALPSLLGPAAHYDVQVDADPFALARGRARAVHIQGEEVQLLPALIVDTLRADAQEVSFDKDTRRLDNVGQTQFTATISQAHLTQYLAQSKPLLPGLLVTLRESDVEADVPISALGLQTTAVLTGTVAPNADDATRLDFQANSARLGPVPLPAVLVNLALDRLNPLIRLPGLKAPLSITRATVQGSRLTLKGTADLNGLVRPL
jgi:hypothetical protein